MKETQTKCLGLRLKKPCYLAHSLFKIDRVRTLDAV
jgi:hypothetical protein